MYQYLCIDILRLQFLWICTIRKISQKLDNRRNSQYTVFLTRKESYDILCLFQQVKAKLKLLEALLSKLQNADEV
jgi:hypothetical protein